MSWLYSQALVAEYLAGTCSDGAPFAPSSGIPTPQAYLSPDKMTAFSRLSRFGMTFAPLTDDLGAALLTWYLAGFPARTSAPPGKGPGSTASDPACGAKWHELSVKYDPATRSWKTHRSLWDEDLPWSSVTLPKWGLMRDGVCSERVTSARPTAENDAGLWPTPNVPNGGRSCAHVTDWRGKSAYHNGKKVQVGLEHAAKCWPTPLATDGSKGGPNQRGSKGDLRLASAVHQWPTPKANDAEKRGNFDASNPRNGLPAAVKSWPTPVATMSKGSSPNALTRKDGQDRSNDRLDHAVMASNGGQLNPTWVEWLMGWPLGWTDLKPLATAKCPSAPLLHGASSMKTEAAHA